MCLCVQEVGHNFRLNHDGSSSTEYFGGFGSYNSPVSWGPIMGSSYYKALSQWSNGNYAGANNREDDIQILANQLGFQADEAGDTRQSAAALPRDGASFKASGVILNQKDVDYWSFSTARSGQLDVTVTPWYADSDSAGSNLDVGLELRSSGGAVVASSTPVDETSASLTVTIPAGKYYLVVYGDASKYVSDYGSVGQYDIVGVAPEDSTVDSTSPTTSPTTATTKSTTPAATTTTDDDTCSCPDNSRKSSKARKSRKITFETDCSSTGYRFQACVEQLERGSAELDVRLQSYDPDESKWSTKYKTKVAGGLGENACIDFVDRTAAVSKGRKWRVKVKNPSKTKYEVRYVKSVDSANQCLQL